MSFKAIALVVGTAAVSSFLTLLTVGAVNAYQQLKAKQSYDEFCNMAEAYMAAAEDDDDDD